MRYHLAISKLTWSLPRFVATAICALGVACGDMSDTSGASRRLNEAATKRGAPAGGEAAVTNGFARPQFAIEIDTSGHKT